MESIGVNLIIFIFPSKKMTEDILKQIEKNTGPKHSFSIVLSSNKTSFNTKFSPPIDLDKSYEIALVNLETYYSFPNIDSTNNHFDFFDGTSADHINIPEGSYEIESLNTTLQSLLKEKGHEAAVTLSPNRNTLKSVMTIKPEQGCIFPNPT